MDIYDVLMLVVYADVLMILALGFVAAFLIATGKESKKFYDRIVPATLMIIGTSIAAGVILWVGSSMFVG